MNEVYEFLKEAKIFYLGTVADNKPRIRPFGALNMFEDKIYIQTGKIKDVSKQMQVNPYIELCAMGKGGWIRVDATAVRDERIEAKEAMLEANPGLKRMYDAHDDNTEVLYLKDVTAMIYGSEVKEYHF